MALPCSLCCDRALSLVSCLVSLVLQAEGEQRVIAFARIMELAPGMEAQQTIHVDFGTSPYYSRSKL